jgi:phosphopantothenoylcysteine synthetase/decarboxylase
MTKKKILWGVTGSIAAEGIHEVYAYEKEFDIKYICTKSTMELLSPAWCWWPVGVGPIKTKHSLMDCRAFYESDRNLPMRGKTEIGRSRIYNLKEDPILHVELARWCDIMVIAPLTLNTLGKMANGICDNLLMSVYFALPKTTHVVVAPAMDTNMWENAVTQQNIVKLQQMSCSHVGHDFSIVGPVEGKLAGGEIGTGAMARLDDIVSRIIAKLGTGGKCD